MINENKAPFLSKIGKSGLKLKPLDSYTITIKPAKYAAGVLPVCLKTGRLLLCKRGAHLETEPNKWANLGGKANIGETAYETAVREFYEESGKIMPIKLIPSFIDEKEDGFKYYNFIGLVEDEFKPIINKLTVDFEVEISDFKWLTLDEFFKFDGNKLHWGCKLFRSKTKEQLKSIFKV